MIDLSIHISKLLFTHDKIIIPGFGYFETKMQDVNIHPVSGEINPKYKIIIFKQDISITDDLLAKSLDNNDVNLEIEKFVAQINDSLSKNKEYYLKNIGTLKMHDKGVLFFEQQMDFNYEKSFFGLENITQKPIKHKVKSAELEDKAPKKCKNKSKLLLLILLAIIIILICLYWAKKQVVISPKISLPADTTQIINNKDTLPTSTIIEDTAKTEDSAIQQVEMPVEKIKNKRTYFIVAGCFKDETKASDYLSKLKASNYPNASIEGKIGKLTMVCYDSFENLKDSKKAMKIISEKEHKQLWIYKTTDKE